MSARSRAPRSRLRIVLPWAIPLLAAAAAALLSPNPGLTAAAFGTLVVVLPLTWRAGEPPVLLFAVSYQWLQVSMKIFHANLLGIPVASLGFFARTELAIWLSLGGLLVLAAGMRLATLGLAPADPAEAGAELRSFSLERMWAFYVAFFAGKEVIHAVAWRVSGLTQSLLAVADLRWFFFFLFAYGAFSRRRRYDLLALAVALEIVFGFTGFFSAFKEIFFALLIAYLTARPRFGARNAATVAGFIGAVMALGVLWMTVRGDYRTYVSQGERSQVVRTEFFERSGHMLSMLLEIDRPALADGIERLAERMAYVDYFAMAALNVPSRIPFEEGALWRSAVEHVLKPRLFFPGKPILLSDSELTMKYTGLWLASGAEGTSISLGYFAESYIDFGPWGMMIPIFLVGFAWGLMYRAFLSRSTAVIYRFAAAVAVLMGANQFEIYSVKLVGGVLTTFLVFAAWMRWGVPAVDPLLRRRAGALPRLPRPANVAPEVQG